MQDCLKESLLRQLITKLNFLQIQIISTLKAWIPKDSQVDIEI